MTLYSELREDVREVLGDPEIKTGVVEIHRTVATTPGANPWDPPVEETWVIRLDAVVFTKSAEYSAGTLVTERGDEITASGRARVVEKNGVEADEEILLDVLDSDVVYVDGDPRRIVRKVRVPAAGDDVVIWKIRVAD
jgi:hypothetical protein